MICRCIAYPIIGKERWPSWPTGQHRKPSTPSLCLVVIGYMGEECALGATLDIKISRAHPLFHDGAATKRG